MEKKFRVFGGPDSQGQPGASGQHMAWRDGGDATQWNQPIGGETLA